MFVGRAIDVIVGRVAIYPAVEETAIVSGLLPTEESNPHGVEREAPALRRREVLVVRLIDSALAPVV